MPETNSLLPCVQWGEHKITRALLGHNPFKGGSHFSKELSNEMREWFDPALKNDMRVIERAEQCGINTCQFGSDAMHKRLTRHKEQGGALQWIATLYDRRRWKTDAPPFEEELAEILAVNPKPIGIQLFGECVDRYFIAKDMDGAREKMKRLRDTGLLLGIGTHLPEVIDVVESQGWDVDFYQTCVYTVYSLVSAADGNRIDRDNEHYHDNDRRRMFDFIQRASKPCIVFKVLGANRKCGADEEVREALKTAYDNIKESDVVLLGMWNKYKDQVGQNTQWVREILTEKPSR